MRSLLDRLLRRGMSCTEVVKVLQSYLDGETEPEVARAVARHLGACLHCDQESQVYADIKASLQRRRGDVDPEVLAALRDFSQQLVDDDGQAPSS